MLLLLSSTEVLVNMIYHLSPQQMFLASLFSQRFCFYCLAYLSSLNTTKATGPDGLSACFLKEISNEIVEPLTALYNESLWTGVIPLEWKKSHITPVHKGDSTDDATNYRPIAVVSVVVKVLEKLVATELSRYLESTAQLYPSGGIQVWKVY